MDYQKALTHLKQFKQEHVLAYWPQLNSIEQEALLKQIQALDFSVLKNKSIETISSFEPLSDLDHPNKEDKIRGKQLIAEGRVGCLLVAGGQGSRLRFEGPKGFFPITVVMNKSLFQVFAEKVLAAGKQAGRPLMLAIMTSPINDEDTKRFFNDHRYFGLNPDQVSFFMQGSLPLLNEQGQLFLETSGKIAEGPDGNGGSLERFVVSGIWKQWQSQGIRYVNYVLIDNPLADPFDASLIGHLDRKNAQVAIKAVERLKVEEKVGVLVKQKDRISVIEYSEMPEAESKAMDATGRPKYACANISLFAFSMDFIKLAADHTGEMPLHKAFKAVNYLTSDGKTATSEFPNAWKFEKFIFDVLAYAQAVTVLIYKREECFAPLKNLDHLNAVREALQQRDREVIKELTGLEVVGESFELAQDFHYPTSELSKAWKGKDLSLNGYIEGKL